jgi:hypothetical protein
MCVCVAAFHCRNLVHFCLPADPSRAETTVFASPSAALPKRSSNKTQADAEEAEEEEEEEEEGEGASLMRGRFCADCGGCIANTKKTHSFNLNTSSFYFVFLP